MRTTICCDSPESEYNTCSRIRIVRGARKTTNTVCIPFIAEMIRVISRKVYNGQVEYTFEQSTAEYLSKVVYDARAVFVVEIACFVLAGPRVELRAYAAKASRVDLMNSSPPSVGCRSIAEGD